MRPHHPNQNMEIRKIEQVEKNTGSSKGLGFGVFSQWKHWGVILYIYDNSGPNYPVLTKLVEAGEINGDCFGTLEAKMSDWIGKRKTEWEKDEGFNRSQAEMPGGPVAYDEDSLDDLIKGVNEKLLEKMFGI